MNEIQGIRESTFTGFPPSGHMNCPMCDYPLTGLPATYACPECGFEYDAETRVLASRLPNWFGHVHLTVTAVLLLLVVPMVGTEFSDWRWPVLLFVIPYMTMPLTVLHTYFRRRRYPDILVVGPEGIAYRASGQKEFRISLLRHTKSVTLKRRTSRIGHDLLVERMDARTIVLSMPFYWDIKLLGPICDAARNRLQLESP